MRETEGNPYSDAPTWRRTLRGIMDVVYPRSCVACGEPGGPEFAYICEACLRDIDFVDDPRCATCGYPFYGVLEVERVCPHCEELEPEWREGRTIALYTGPTRLLVQKFKYQGAKYLAKDLGRMMERSPGLLEWLGSCVLVPTPLHPRRERERGYNQSELIARELGKLAKAPVVKALQRARDTQTQTRLSRKQRSRNMRGAFSLNDRMSIDPRLSYIVVDDVLTTGATLNACCAALRLAGVKDLRVLTLAHG